MSVFQQSRPPPLFGSPRGRAYYLGPALTHFRCHRVYIVSTRTERITLTLAHFPLPYFHFAESDLPPPLPTLPTSTRPSPTLDGTDLIGRVFNDPDLGLCRVTGIYRQNYKSNRSLIGRNYLINTQRYFK